MAVHVSVIWRDLRARCETPASGPLDSPSGSQDRILLACLSLINTLEGDLACPSPTHSTQRDQHDMAKVSTLTWSSFAALFSAQGAYQVGYAWLFGMSTFSS